MLANQTINNRYLIKSEIGQGGMGTVYRAFDRLTLKDIALKQVNLAVDDLSFNKSSTQNDVRVMLMQEFQLLARLRHPHIIEVFDFAFTHENQPFYTMQLLDHPPDIFTGTRDKSFNEKIQTVLETLRALAYLHRHRIIHRDLKPSNILLDTDGVVRVVDFGLAVQHATQTEVAGTVAYMAPELLLGDSASYASDLFALGVIAYQVFTGKHPFWRGNLNAYFELFLQDEMVFDESQLPEPTIPLFRRLLCRQPADRYQSAMEVIQDGFSAFNLPVTRETEDIRDSYLQTADFVGRDAEFALVTHAVQDMIPEKRGSMWIVSGESGVGKSRFVDELRIRALVNNVYVLVGRSTETSQHAYDLWQDIVPRLVLDTIPTSEQSRHLLDIFTNISQILHEPVDDDLQLRDDAQFQALTLTIRDLIRQLDRPVLLIVEDLHWSTDSIRLLQQISVLSDEMPLMIVGTYRDDETPYLIGKFQTANHIELGRLTRHDITKASQSMLGEVGTRKQVVDLLETQSEGNAFFLIEIIRALAEDADQLADIGLMTLPANVLAGGVQSLIRQRLDKIPVWGQPLLQYSALIGRTINFDLLDELNAPENPVVEDWLMICANATVLSINNGEWYFAHSKIRDVIHDDLSDEAIRNLHHDIAVAIETVFPEDDKYKLSLIRHWRYAEEWEKAIAYCLEISPKLLQTSRFNDVITWTAALIHHVDDLPTRQRNDALMQLSHYLATAYERKGEFENSKMYFETSNVIANQLDRRDIQAANFAGLSIVSRQTGRFAEGLDYAQRSVRLYRLLENRYGLADSLNKLGLIQIKLKDYLAASEAFQESLQLLRDLNQAYGISITLHNLGLVADDLKEYENAIQYYEDSLVIKQQIGDQYNMAATLNNLGLIYRERGDLDKAREVLEQSLAIKQRIGDKFGIAATLGNLGKVAFSQKQYDDARDYYHQTLERFVAIENRWAVGVSHFLLGLTYHYQWNGETADTHLREAITIFEDLDDKDELLRCKAVLIKNEISLMKDDTKPLIRDCLALIKRQSSINYQSLFVAVICYVALSQFKDSDASRWLGWLMTQTDIDGDTQLMIDDLYDVVPPQDNLVIENIWDDIAEKMT